MVDGRIRAHGLLRQALQELDRYTTTMEDTAVFVVEHPCSQPHEHDSYCWLEHWLSRQANGLPVKVDGIFADVAFPPEWSANQSSLALHLPWTVIGYYVLSREQRNEYYKRGMTGYMVGRTEDR